MSQNVHTLHLFFEDPIRLKYCQLVFQYLQSDNPEQAERWAEKLGGADLAKLWNSDWFNHGVRTQGPALVLNFDSSKHDGIPLQMLEELFDHGLRSAVAEVFYDQVGETERMHFDRGQWVSRKAFMDVNPQWRDVVEPAQRDGAGPGNDGEDGSEADDPYACSKDPTKPLAVAKLRQQEEKRMREAQEAAEAFIDMARAMGKSGKSPVQGLIAVLLLRAGLKGLLHAAAFTVVTVLLFKGFWLWMGLGLALAVVLPLYYIVTEHKELRGDDGDDENNSDNDDNDDRDPGDGAPATVMAPR